MLDVITETVRTAQHLTTSSRELSAAAEQLSRGTQELAASLEETAASLEQMTSTAAQSATKAQEASLRAVGSEDAGVKSGDGTMTAVRAIGEISASSQKIANILTVIDEVAFQTNLLALNAAVEAARAGEQGRGFAVVAAEVRNLAQRSATAAKEIKGLIQDSVGKVETGSELVHQSGRTLEEIVTSVTRVADIIAEIAAASQEQSTGIDQVNKAVAQMDQVVQSNTAQTEELSSTAQALASQAAQLQALVGQFTLEQDAAGGTPLVITVEHPLSNRPALAPATSLEAPQLEGVTTHAITEIPTSRRRQDDRFEEF